MIGASEGSNSNSNNRKCCNTFIVVDVVRFIIYTHNDIAITETLKSDATKEIKGCHDNPNSTHKVDSVNRSWMCDVISSPSPSCSSFFFFHFIIFIFRVFESSGARFFPNRKNARSKEKKSHSHLFMSFLYSVLSCVLYFILFHFMLFSYVIFTMWAH